ncbi:MAG TPA: nucleotide sugar dehydrogenase [Candidatus Xenobia bacterium]|jgi:UDP-N-acetyl-D-mannosaminuronic acid dehydrogenase
MDERICVIGGCGHVGLPLGIVLAGFGYDVTLLDVDPRRVAGVQSGRMPFMDEGAEEALVKALAAGTLHATTDSSTLAQHDVLFVTIGTPVDNNLDPDLDLFDTAMDSILHHARNGQLVILRSTVFPGVTERLARRIAQRGLAIDVAHCPERVAQGVAMKEHSRLPQLMGALSDSAAARARRIFERLGVRVIELSPVEAELAKLFSNAYRYINFAISNQFYTIAEKLGADFYRIHQAATTEYPRLAGFAGAGFSGGPCLLKDTMQLAGFNHNGFAIGQAAMMVNEGLPAALVDLVRAEFDLSGKTAGILGMAFKGNNDDRRDSLSFKLRRLLSLFCERVLCTDPYVHDADFKSLEETVAQSDILFLGACHDAYRNLRIDQPVVDIFNFMQGATIRLPGRARRERDRVAVQHP